MTESDCRSSALCVCWCFGVTWIVLLNHHYCFLYRPISFKNNLRCVCLRTTFKRKRCISNITETVLDVSQIFNHKPNHWTNNEILTWWWPHVESQRITKVINTVKLNSSLNESNYWMDSYNSQKHNFDLHGGAKGKGKSLDTWLSGRHGHVFKISC